MSKVIFTFLYNFVDNKELSNHWEKCLRQIDTLTKSNIYFSFNVLNPKNMADITAFFSSCGINESNLLFLQDFNIENNTSSIADATLLMIQKSIMTLKAKNIKKFVILSENACPIYDFNYILNEIIHNSKSYLYGTDLTNQNTQVLDHYFKSLPYRNQSHYFNQSMILDISHIKYFFLESTLTSINSKPTYIISNDYICISNLKNIIVAQYLNEDSKRKELNDLINSYKNEDSNYCYPTNSQLFGNFIIRKLLEERKTIFENLKILSYDFIRNNIKLNDQVYKSLKDIIITDNFKLGLKDANIITDNLTENGYQINLLKSSYISGHNSYLCNNSYQDVSTLSINPFDLYKNYLLGKLESLDLNDFIETPTLEEANSKLLRFPSLNKRFTLPKLSSLENPLTYSTWSARNMVNMLLLLKYIDLDESTSNFGEIYRKYLTILISNKLITIDGGIRLTLDKNDDKYTKKMYGRKISSEDIIIARSIGCLFINNCQEDSGIKLYTDILMQKPELNIKKVINDIIIDKLPEYGITFDNFEKFTDFIRKYHVKQSDHSSIFVDKFKTDFICILKDILAEGKFFSNKLQITNSKINKTYTIGRQLGKGGWNVAFLLEDEEDASKKLVLRHFFYNPMFIKPIDQNLKTSFFDNYSSILLTIIQKSIFNFEFVNNCTMIGIDHNEDITTSKYIFTINEKADMSCYDYFIRHTSYSKQKFLDMTSKIFTKLFFMQKTIKFIHYDLHLENIFCSYKEDDDIFTPFISDLGTSEFTINGYRFKGNPEFDRSSTDAGADNFGKDVVYYFISTIKKLYRHMLDKETGADENIIDILVWIFILFSFCITDESKVYYRSTFNNNDEFLELIYSGNAEKLKAYIKTKLSGDKEKRSRYIADGKKGKEEDYVKTIIDERAIFVIKYDFREFFIENIMPNIMSQLNLETNISNTNYYQKYLKYKNKYLKYKRKLNL